MQDETKNRIPSNVNCGEIGYNDLSPQEQHRIKDALLKGLTRREFVGWLMAAGVTMASAGTILTSAKEAIAATPKKGGKVRVGLAAHGPADTMDPILATTGIDNSRHRCHYNSLVQSNDVMLPEPELAEEWSPNHDLTEYTFKIRKDVEFHDGSKLTADDVVWSMQRHMGDDSKSVVKPLMKAATEWKKIDSHTVKVVLSSPDIDFVNILGMWQFKIVKKDTTNWQNPPGTGPYTLKEFKPGVRSVHERNNNYWREGANLDVVEITAITDAVARVNALLSRDMQLIENVDPKAVRQIESTPGVSVSSTPCARYMVINCLKNMAPGNNDDFVMAMKLIQNRERILKSILKGHGMLGNDQPINNVYADHCDTIQQRNFDPDKAKFHLKKSGITEAEIHVAEVVPGITDTVLLAQREASKIGLKLNIKRVPTDGYYGAVWIKTPINVAQWFGRATANAMLTVAYSPGAPWNDTKWDNERVGELLVLARGESDAAKRKEMYCEIQTTIHNECGAVIPAFVNYTDGISDKVKGMPNVPLSSLSGHEWPEFIWLG